MLNVVGKGCGLEKLQTVIDAVAHGLRDPDERRARRTHSLGEPGGLLPVRQRLLDMIGHSPRRSNLCTSTLRSSRGGGNWIDHGGTVIGNEANAAAASPEVIASPSGRKLESFALDEYCPGHARVLRRDGDDRLP